MGASNDAREVEAWIKAGTGDDKTDILIIADAYDRGAIYSRDRNLTSNGNAIPFGGADSRSTNKPGGILMQTAGAPSFFESEPRCSHTTRVSKRCIPIRSTIPTSAFGPFPGVTFHNSPFYNSNFHYSISQL